MIHLGRAAATIVVLASVLCLPTPAQPPETGSFRGVVVDSSGSALPGVEVTIRDRETNEVVALTVTAADGSFQFPSRDPGTYSVTAELEGFSNQVKEFVPIIAGQTTTAKFVMAVLTEEEKLALHAVVNSASQRPGYLEQSRVAPNMIATGFGQNFVPDGVSLKADDFPLEEILDGFEVWAEQEGQREPCYPLSVFPNQFSCIFSSGAAPGEWSFFASYFGEQSNGLRTRVAQAQPGIYARNSNGQDEGTFTNLTFNLITKSASAKPGEGLIAWYTGGGPGLSDDVPGPVDKQSQYDDILISVGGAIVPRNDILYSGSSGSCPGLDQLIFYLPPDALTGCAVPVIINFRIGETIFAANPVTIPISSDGGPCNDPHGFSAAQTDRMGTEGSIDVGTFFTQELLSFSGSDSARISYFVKRFTQRTYRPRPPLNSCAYRWFPNVDAFRPLDLALSGGISLNHPLGQFEWNNQQAPTNYSEFLFNLPANRAGPYSLDFHNGFAIGGVGFSDSRQGTYGRAAASTLEQFGADIPPLVIDSSLQQVLDTISQSGITDPDAYVDYQAQYLDDSFGTHEIRCAIGFRFDAEPLTEQERMLRENFVRDPVQASVSVEVREFDVNRTPQEGAVDYLEDEFVGTATWDVSPPIAGE